MEYNELSACFGAGASHLQELGRYVDEIVDYTKEDFSQKYKDSPFNLIIDSIGGAAALQGMHALHCTCTCRAIAASALT